MSVHVTSAVWKGSQADGTARLVLLRLADQADDAGWCWPSLEGLAADCRVSVASVQRALIALQKGEELARWRRGRKQSNVYRVLVGTPAVVTVPAGFGSLTPYVTGQNDRSTVIGQSDQSPSGDWSSGAPVIGHSCDQRTVIEPPEEDTSEQVSSLEVAGESDAATVTTVPLGVQISQVDQPAVPARRDLLFEAVAEVCGWDMFAVTDRARGWINGALPDLRKLGATPDQVRWKARIYRANDPAGKRPTPSALVKHWPALTAASLERVNRKQLDRELAQQQSEQQLRRELENR